MLDNVELADRYFNTVLVELFPNIKSLRSYGNGFSKLANGGYKLDLDFDVKNLDYISPPFQEDINKSLIHFTSLEVLFSILNEKFFRLSPFSTANDVNELRLLNQLLDPQNDKKQNDFSLKRVKNKFMFASFCPASILGTDKELLFWRLYGGNAQGVALQVKLHNFDYYKQTDSYLGKVMYDIPVEEIKRFKKKHESFKSTHNITKLELNEIFGYFSSFYKSKSFKHEQEIRLIHYNQFGNRSDDYGVHFKNGKIYQHRRFPITKSEIEPYIEIQKIFLGPKYGLKQREDFLHNFMRVLAKQKLGYFIQIGESTLEEHIQ